MNEGAHVSLPYCAIDIVRLFRDGTQTEISSSCKCASNLRRYPGLATPIDFRNFRSTPGSNVIYAWSVAKSSQPASTRISKRQARPIVSSQMNKGRPRSSYSLGVAVDLYVYVLVASIDRIASTLLFTVSLSIVLKNSMSLSFVARSVEVSTSSVSRFPSCSWCYLRRDCRCELLDSWSAVFPLASQMSTYAPFSSKILAILSRQ
jgi:hypothetical protein